MPNTDRPGLSGLYRSNLRSLRFDNVFTACAMAMADDVSEKIMIFDFYHEIDFREYEHIDQPATRRSTIASEVELWAEASGLTLGLDYQARRWQTTSSTNDVSEAYVVGFDKIEKAELFQSRFGYFGMGRPAAKR
jgi:hypothetical protein